MRMSLTLAVAALLSVTCSSSGTAEDQPVIVAGAWPIEALLGERLPEGQVSVEPLIPPGVEPHDLELDADALAILDEAAAIVYVGGGFQPALERAIEGRDGLLAIDVLEFAPDLRRDGAAIDPHVWLDPAQWRTIGDRVLEELSSQIPGLEPVAHGSASADPDAPRMPDRLGRAYSLLLSGCRGTLITEHDAFGYLPLPEDVEYLPLTGVSPEAEATAPRLEAAIDRARASGTRAIFAERGGEGRLARTVADAADLPVLELDPLEQAIDGESYADRMEANLEQLRQGLDCPSR